MSPASRSYRFWPGVLAGEPIPSGELEWLKADGRRDDPPGRAGWVTLLIEVVRGLAPALVRAAGLAVPRGLATPGFAGVPGLAPALAFAAARLADGGRAGAGLAAADRAAAGRAGLFSTGAGFAADIAFAAAVSALVAVVMALVAVFIACKAVDIVFADDVALVAAVVILVAASVTFAAADDTVFAAAAALVVLLAVVRGLLAAARARPAAAGLAAVAVRLVLPGAAPLRDLVCPRLAELPLATVRVVRCTGIDLPPNSDQLRETYSTVSGQLHRQASGTGRTGMRIISFGVVGRYKRHLSRRPGAARETTVRRKAWPKQTQTPDTASAPSARTWWPSGAAWSPTASWTACPGTSASALVS